MFKVSKTFRFEASHQLMYHDGQCRNLHGHSWVVRVSVFGSELISKGPKANMLIDFDDIKKAVKPLIDKLDHQHLNDVLHTSMPTSEYLAQWMHGHVRSKLGTMTPISISVEETCTSAVEYSEEA